MKKNLIIYDKSGRKKKLSRKTLNKTSFKILAALKFFIITAVCFHQLLFILIMIAAFSLKTVNPGFNSLMIYRSTVNKQKNQKSIFIPYKNIPVWTRRYMVGIEDDRFYKHYGIDPQAIKRAYGINKRLGFNYSGGSTITQQLARTLFLSPKKNYLRKYFEVVIAMELELFLSKERILELYLNNIEFGRGVYGIGRAAVYYYGKSFGELSMDEINTLITIVPSPRRYTPFNFYYNDILLSRYMVLTGWSAPKEKPEDESTELSKKTEFPSIDDED
jgi:membrane peptidoglycan carboxypeptidase